MKKSILLLALSLIITAISAQKLQLQEGKAYQNGTLFTGVDVTFFADSDIKESETSYTKGLKDGQEILYYKNGQMKADRSWKAGQKEGMWTNWDEDGNKTAEAPYKKNKKHGTWIIWSSKGTKLFEMHYKNGEKVDKWLQWNEAGELIMEKDF